MSCFPGYTGIILKLSFKLGADVAKATIGFEKQCKNAEKNGFE